MKIEKWQVWTLDVWGNEIDGYDVNDRSRAGYIELVESYTDHDILQALKDENFLKESVKFTDINIDGDDTLIFIDSAENAYPLFQLTLTEIL
jgi:hypothetical protein